VQLLADAKLAEDSIEDVIGANGPDDFAQGLESGPDFGRD
jgi:hypothetical protein